MGEADKKEDKKERRFSREQYDMLLRCSDKKDMAEWNEWRKDNPNEEILLRGAEFGLAVLKGVNLNNADLQGAHLSYANLEDSDLYKAHLERAVCNGANLQEVDLRCAHLEGANLRGANLQGANLEGANLQRVHLWETKLQEANLSESDLQGAKLMRAYLQRAEFGGAKLQGADFSRAIVDGGTLIWRCKVDHKTKFEGVGLDGARIYPETKQLLEYNIRRMNWEQYYKQHKILKWPVWLFWLMSDYGLSTGRIIITFLVLMIAFACVYYVWGMIAPPGIVDYLFVDANGVGVVWWLVPIRAIHFSVVIMTVGFTNMHANAHSMWAHLLVSLQMILGFVLLGALVTRFAVLFTAGGPAGKFAEEKKEENQNEETGG